jgi:hypothetical protein
MRMIGILERSVPKTGINPKIKTMSDSVKIYGNPPCPAKTPIAVSPILVNTAFARAITDCALKINPNPLAILCAMDSYSI